MTKRSFEVFALCFAATSAYALGPCNQQTTRQEFMPRGTHNFRGAIRSPAP